MFWARLATCLGVEWFRIRLGRFTGGQQGGELFRFETGQTGWSRPSRTQSWRSGRRWPIDLRSGFAVAPPTLLAAEAVIVGETGAANLFGAPSRRMRN